MSRTSNRITVSLMALTIGAGALAAAPAFAHNDRGGQAGHRAQNPFPPTQQRAPQGDTIGAGALAAAPAFAHNDRGGQAGHRAQNPFPPTQQRAPQGDTIGAGALAAAPAFAHNDRGGQAGHRAQNPFPPTQQRAPQGDTIGTGATLVPGGGQNSGDDNFNPRGDGGQGGTPFGIRRGRSFQVNCEFVTSGVFDPILSPGTNPFGHNHQFFGAESINAGSTTASLVAANTTRNSTSCLQSRDGSAYWVPALMADPTADSAGTAIEPDETRIWYSAPRGQRVRAFPAGFTLIAGDKSATTLQENAGWRCEDDPPRMPLEATPPDCDVDEGIVGVVRFPNCWDGKTVSSPTQAHVAYRTGRTCPTTHRYPVPELTMEVFWAGDGEAHTYGLSSGDTAGLHADFMNGWERRALRNNVRRWLNGR